MGRDDEPEERAAPPGAGPEAAIDRIVEIGRRTRKPTPRWLWIAAIVVGALAAGGFAAVMFAEPQPTTASRVERSPGGAGLGSGLIIGVAVGIVIGYAIARSGSAGPRSNA
jgi:protein-S-isoprenylcysteine O-methyltransferase Ste14